MTQQEMNGLVPQKLGELEREFNMKVLYAAESGSRAWGFASPDSDFDVRFIYVRPKDFYLKLENTRDVIEMPIDATWDVSGWDLPKMLRLLHNANPSIYEWAASPLIYHTTEAWQQQLLPTLSAFFQPVKSINHYLSMARRHVREHLTGETIRAKKYFYILRSILAANWVAERRCPPPVPFEELVEEQLAPGLKPLVADLVRQKREALELGHIPRIAVLDKYIYAELDKLDAALLQLPPPKNLPWEPLNQLFADILAAGVKPI